MSSKNKPSEAELEALAAEYDITPNRLAGGGAAVVALINAEKKGWGPALRRWMVEAKVLDSKLATRYGGEARGRVALDADAWPPAPARGGKYTRKEYEGVLASLAYSPEAAAMKGKSLDWAKAFEVLVPADSTRRLLRLGRRADDAMWLRNAATLEHEPTPEDAKREYRRLVGELERLGREMDISTDPSLYDGSRKPAEVYRLLCELEVEFAKRILRDNYGVRFTERHDAYSLCDGSLSLNELDAKADAAAREEARQQAKHDAERRTDAEALLAVAADASSRGELTERRFNLAYWRLHPELTSSARERVRLTLTHFIGARQVRGVAPEGEVTQAFVRGPLGWGFAKNTSHGDEARTIAELLDEIRGLVQPPQEKNTSMTKPKTKKSSSKTKTKTKTFRITSRRRQALAWAGNAWRDQAGSSTNFNGAKDMKLARELIAAGYLEKTDEGRFAGKGEIKAKLTDKGHQWLMDNDESFAKSERLRTDGGNSITTPAKPAKKAAARKSSSKKQAASKKPRKKKPSWRYTTYRNVRHRFREVDGELFVDRRKDERWEPATPAAAKAVHEKSQSPCAIAARILPTCGTKPKSQTSPSKPKKRLPLTDTEKNAMREFLGL